MDERSRYRFGPLERRGLIAGWRGGQIASVATALVIAVLVIRAQTNAAGAAIAIGVIGLSLVVACWPIGGRTCEEWAPTVARWVMTGRRGRKQRTVEPQRGQLCDLDENVSGGALHDRTSGELPAAFGGLVILEVDRDGRQVDSTASGTPFAGILEDRRERTYTAIMRVRAHSFALLGGGDKQRRVTGWGSILASLAREGSAVHRLQWLAATFPDDGRAVHGYFRERAVLEAVSPAWVSYQELLTTEGADTCRHEVLLAVQVRPSRRTLRTKRAAGDDATRACGVAVREALLLWRLLEDADIEVEALLGPSAVADALRRPVERRPLSDHAVSRSVPKGSRSVLWPWPMAIDAHWSNVRVDGTWHATYWIGEWPRIDVGPDFLGPLLLGSVRRSLSVVMEPVSPAQAIRHVEQARTADIADAELRSRGGFLRTARRSRETDIVLRREHELADGHASFRFTGYVTVTAPTESQLEAACDATEQAAGQAHLSLRRLFGDQAGAFTCTLPLCRGLS